MILFSVLLAGVLAYVIAAALIAGGIHSRYPRLAHEPTVSVVIPARNEEQNISHLLESLLDVDYPADRMEVVVVNDQSSDRTREVAESFRGRFHCRYEIFDVEPEPNSSLRAKTRPLAQGLDRAHGELVLMPDADNRVPRHWVRGMTTYFADGVGLVCGPTLPDPERQNHHLLAAFETVDAAFLLGSCAGFSGLGSTQALIGSNFAVRRSAYEEIGTFRSLDHHEIEDLSLLHALQSTGRWRAVFPAEHSTLLLTAPQRSLRDFIQQRRRWMGGWQRVQPAIRAALTMAIVLHILWPLLIFISLPLMVAVYGLLVAGDSFVAARMLGRYGRARLIPLLILYPVFTAIYATGLLYLMAIRRQVRWKERTY